MTELLPLMTCCTLMSSTSGHMRVLAWKLAGSPAAQDRLLALDPTECGTHSMRRTKATLIYRRTKNCSRS